jgi:hypothetical protein
MTSILYYSNFCEFSKKLLQSLSKSQVNKGIHFICIDKRVKEGDGKMYIVLESGQKIVFPENVVKVPALLLLNDNCKVLYGENITNYLKPIQENINVVSTQNNMEPMAFSLNTNGGSYGGIVSDNYSFLDMDSESLTAKGNGGLRQIHQYSMFNENMNESIQTPNDEHGYKQSKMAEGTIEALQKSREEDYSKMETRR